MFSNKTRTATVAVVTMAFLLGTVPVEGQEVVGVNSAVRNVVNVRRNQQSEFRPAAVRDKVSLGNQVNTGKASALQVTLLDKSNLTVGPNANFTVNRFVYDPSRKASSVGASVAKGTFRFMSGKAKKEGGNAVQTPAATIGIRGTIFEGAVGEDAMLMARLQGLKMPAKTDPATATMIVLRGPGPKAQMGEHPGMIDVTAGGKTVTLSTPGLAVFVPFPGAAPIGPFQISQPAYSSFDAVLRTAPSSFGTTMAALQAAPGGAFASAAGSTGAGAGARGAAGASGSSAGGGSAGLLSILAPVTVGLAALVAVVADNGSQPDSP
ncbi:FecR family protein [Novosphingobium album (ex Hu et al. 2023)]|uniref:FecR domain-containing protein n=1 Tax=Novosphingobium album (ex Hu et al. 2023) TaxID=2930093 RepID=A0ABT0AZV1_9SPHN|nr:FecR domain-containing protein [Novosphingobium album (ex Hu et al. 2023)]MCJ2178170.1 FecR domain-containing protein [Novosphingobium album (ex Hu et al. 2023)]